MRTDPVHTFTDELAGLDASPPADAVASAARPRSSRPPSGVPRPSAADQRRRDRRLRAVLASPLDHRSGPFAGVPTFIKDSTDVEGLPTRQGSGALRGTPAATRTELIAQQMFDMGMVGLGKSTLPEFGFTPSTEFPAAPRLYYSSSGGAAARRRAVAHGADGGGSTGPAAGCVWWGSSRGSSRRTSLPSGSSSAAWGTAVHAVAGGGTAICS
jgi:amidase